MVRVTYLFFMIGHAIYKVGMYLEQLEAYSTQAKKMRAEDRRGMY